MNRKIPLAPAEGWLTLGLVILLCLTVAWAIDDVALVLGQERYTDHLPLAAVLGVLCGFIGPKVGWGRWRTYLIGACFAVLVTAIVVGRQLPDGGVGGLGVAFHATAESTMQAVLDLTVKGQELTTQYGHFMLVLGLLVWATSMFASYAVFGHRRPLNAIVVVGLLLLVNMSLTLADQIFYLVLFSLASLFLLVRFHVLDEQTEWLRRRIGDPASIAVIYLRGGTVFITVAVVGSILLMNVAKSAPLEGVWAGFGNNFVEFSRSIQRFLPTGGNTRPIGSDFDPSSTTIRGKWQPNAITIGTITLPLGAPESLYWRTVSYDQYTLNGWRRSVDPTQTEVAAGDPLLAGTAEVANLAGTTKLTYKVTPNPAAGPFLLAPLTPTAVDQATDVSVIGATGNFNMITRHGNDPYTVTAQVRTKGNDTGELNVAALEAAGTAYPDEVKALYTPVPDGAMPAGGQAEQLLDQLVTQAGPKADNPYDFADFLRTQFVKDKSAGGLFEYQTDILDLMANECKDISSVECFATYRRGFCQYYATTMAIFLRERGIPARIVEGYLPGKRDAKGVEVITGEGRHEWVEVYFPRYGWVSFDPTGGGRSRQTALPAGVPGASPLPAPSGGAFPTRPPTRDEPSDSPGGGTGGSLRLPVASLIAIALMLAAVVGGLAFIAWQRGPRGGTTADHAYRTVTRIAARLGFGPRPSQTVFEYSGALGELLPIAKPELETVAAAKVETVYGHVQLSDERLRALRDAERRLRMNLLRLAFRRRDRRPKTPR